MNLYEIANKLLTWDVIKSRGIRDVMVDLSTNTVALVGDPLKIELHFIIPHFIYNKDFVLNTSFARHFDIPIEVKRWDRSYTVQYTRPGWFQGRDEDGGEHLEDFLSNLSHAIRDVLIAGGESVEEESIRCTLLALPGYPYTEGVTGKIYSAKQKKEITAARPVYMTTVENDSHEKVTGVNFCKFLPVVCASGKSAIVGRFNDGMDFIVTHATMMAQHVKASGDAAEILKGCPGMLFPSLATGLIPAANFGETILVIRPDVILPSMKPYKERGQYSALTYSTDVWTETAGSFVGSIAAKAWQQLHGDVNWYYTSHLYTLGPDIKEEGFGGENVRVISSTKLLGTVLRKKFKKWKRDLNEEQVTELGDQPSGERYAYLESKLNIILGWDCVPFAVAPQQWADKISANLGSFGFKGKILAVPLEADMLEALEGRKYGPKTDYLIYKYSWIARDVIINHANEHGLVFPVME